jgi:hypothetical protein
MDSADLRQLKQRIALRCQLEPLPEPETKGYIQRRLQRAGANSHAATIFPDEAMSAVYRCSHGIPRLINTICENALIATYAEKSQGVHPETIDEIARDLRLNVVTRPPSHSSPVTDGQRSIANSLLELVEVLERVARGRDSRESTSDRGVKIV